MPPALWVSAESADGAQVDLIGGVFRLLALTDEHQVAEEDRDRRGIFPVGALPSPRRQVLAAALVEHHVTAIRQLLLRAGPLPEASTAALGDGGCAVS